MDITTILVLAAVLVCPITMLIMMRAMNKGMTEGHGRMNREEINEAPTPKPLPKE